jgi:ribonuclease BN (tRNA processing enzyme)
MISIVLLGTGGAVPTPDRSPTASWITLDDRTLLLDPGPGALSRLIKSPHGPNSLDAVDSVLLTHLHPDHCADLVPLFFALRLSLLTSQRPLQLIGPRGLASYLERLGDLYGEWMEPRQRAVVVTELSPGEVLIPATDSTWAIGSDTSQASIQCFQAAHFEDHFSAWNLGYRFQDSSDHTLVCSGDSGPCDTLDLAATGADLLVVECSTPDDMTTDGHMSPGRIARLAQKSNPGRIVLTHLYSTVDKLDAAALVREQWPGNVVVARDDDCFTIPHPALKDPTCER